MTITLTIREVRLYPFAGDAWNIPLEIKAWQVVDRIGQALTQLGYSLVRKHLFPDGVDGYCFRVTSAEIVYQIDSDDETVLISFFRRMGPRNGLRNYFSALIWFVGFLAAHSQELGVKRVKGLVWAQPGEWAGELPAERIVEFYKRLYGAKRDGASWLGEWVCLELSEFKSSRQSGGDSKYLIAASDHK